MLLLNQSGIVGDRGSSKKSRVGSGSMCISRRVPDSRPALTNDSKKCTVIGHGDIVTDNFSNFGREGLDVLADGPELTYGEIVGIPAEQGCSSKCNSRNDIL